MEKSVNVNTQNENARGFPEAWLGKASGSLGSGLEKSIGLGKGGFIKAYPKGLLASKRNPREFQDEKLD